MNHIQRVLAVKQLPTRFPFVGSAVWILIFDRLDAPPWLWGVAWTCLAFIWIAAFNAINRENATEISELMSRTTPATDRQATDRHKLTPVPTPSSSPNDR